MKIKPKYFSLEGTPMLYYKFLTRLGLFLSEILSLVFLAFIFISFMAYGLSSFLSVIIFVLYIVGFILTIFVHIWLFRMEWRGFHALLWTYILADISYILTLISMYSLSDPYILGQLTGSVLSTILMLVFLSIYFQKRRPLFSPYIKPSTPEVSVSEYIENDTPKTVNTESVIKSKIIDYVQENNEDNFENIINDIQPTTELPAESKSNKVRYCKYCGSDIDSLTKKCNGCGKQFFRIPKAILPVILAVLLIISIILNVVLYTKNVDLSKDNLDLTQINLNLSQEKSDIEKTVSAKQQTISTLYSEKNELTKEIDELETTIFLKTCTINSMKPKTNFMDDYIVIVGDSNNKYHKYGCEDLDLSYFYAYNIDNAKAQGYKACSKCN